VTVALTEEQRRAAFAPTGVLITAGAGTGKTLTLVHRYRTLVERGLSPLAIVAVTFTEAAAQELRSRLRRELAESYPGLLPELEAAPIGTIHSLAARVCREHPKEAGVPADFRVQDEVEAALWLAEHLTLAMAKLPSHVFEAIPASVLKKALKTLLADPIAAEEAFRHGPKVLKARVDALLKELLHEAERHLRALRGMQGPPGDKIEEQRLAVLVAAQEGQEHLWPVADAVNLQGGSFKKWGSKERLAEVKAELKSLRELAERALPLVYTPEHEAAWEALKEAFSFVWEELEKRRREARVLDFVGLEVHALKALYDPEVQSYYKARWKHALVDEHQDTNPIQWRILRALFEPGELTLVGDPQQSIYRFRRADPRLFAASAGEAPEKVTLKKSFRSHRDLVADVNRVFKDLMPDYQPLEADRDPPHPGPHLEAFLISPEAGSTAERRRAEAREVARRIRRYVEEGLSVWDRAENRRRPARWSDFAVLALAWAVLEDFALALLAEGVPAVLTRGGSLLETREAKDGLALIRFLADPSDSLALVALLRSPFFAVSDRVLQENAPPNDETTWWEWLNAGEDKGLKHAKEVLSELLRLRRREPPSRLLQLADRMTGYTAVLKNLPLNERRLADWRAFLALVRELELGNEDVFTVARKLRRLLAAGVGPERPPLASGDAVTLSTIHSAKGLEWPVVFLVGLDYKGKTHTPDVLLAPELGVGLRLGEEWGDKDGVYQILSERRKEEEGAELVRLLYVGMTRAADHLVVSAAGEKNAFKVLEEHLPEPEVIEPNPQDLTPPPPPELPTPKRVILEEAPFVLDSLPVTALDDYRRCPWRFYLAHVLGHPGAGEEQAIARRVGEVVHTAIARGILPQGPEDLAPLDPGLPHEALREAALMVRRFFTDPTFERFRKEATDKELPLTLELDGLRLSGRADLVGPNWVLDFKTDHQPNPEDHYLQLWAYAVGLGKAEAYLAYLRTQEVVPVKLDGLEKEAERVVKRIRSKNFRPTPTSKACTICPYREESLCETDISPGEPHS